MELDTIFDAYDASSKTPDDQATARARIHDLQIRERRRLSAPLTKCGSPQRLS